MDKVRVHFTEATIEEGEGSFWIFSPDWEWVIELEVVYIKCVSSTGDTVYRRYVVSVEHEPEGADRAIHIDPNDVDISDETFQIIDKLILEEIERSWE